VAKHYGAKHNINDPTHWRVNSKHFIVALFFNDVITSMTPGGTRSPEMVWRILGPEKQDCYVQKGMHIIHLEHSRVTVTLPAGLHSFHP
jgi:hypothetical protein